jgi:uncharacterized SAM-binding protein YcdF (DUF218 family)
MKIILALVFFAIGILLIHSFLGPDDLSSCSDGPTGSNPCDEADVIVAVSGGDTVARTNEAIKLYKQGWAPKLVFSGAAEDPSGPSNAAVMRRTALASDVPKEDILIDENSRTTKQNAEETAELLDKSTLTSIILVTSGYHQRRTSLEFGEIFSSAKIRNHPVGQDKQWSRWWWITPMGWYLALGELVRIGMFYVGVTR